MIRLRPLQEKDFPRIQEFSRQAHAGMTSLPKETGRLRQRVERALNTFAAEEPSKEGLYLFVAENILTDQVIGTTAIDANPSWKEPKYFFRREFLALPPLFDQKNREASLLHFHQEAHSPSEIGGLFLEPEFRQEGIGKLLSYGRFLFIALFRNLFTDILSAELRGISDESEQSPFWEHVGQHFCSLSFREILDTLETGRSFLPSLFPPFPIYADLLPPQVQEVLGKTHPRTRPALSLLQGQNFRETPFLDLFDAGPRLQASIDAIPLVQKMEVQPVESISSTSMASLPKYFVGTATRQFACCISHLEISSSAGVILPKETAEALRLQKGDRICYAKAESSKEGT